MDETRRQHLAESWLANEEKIEAARNLKAGPVDPIERLEELERDQDAIEFELGLAYLEELRKNRGQSPNQG